MHGKSSKRQRKHKAVQSLKSKHAAPRADALDLLGEELRGDAEETGWVDAFECGNMPGGPMTLLA